jgi:lipoprotein-releasing system permease protein
MFLPADIFLALRYLRPKRTFISVITLLSILGPVLGVALLIIVTSVMSGFDRDIRDRILDMQAHLQVYPGYGMAGGNGMVFEDPSDILAALKEVGAQGAPVMEGPVLIQIRDEVTTKYLKGIVPELEKHVTNVHRSGSFTGRYDIKEGEALIGQEMALELGLDIGDQVLIHSPKRLTNNVTWEEDGQVTVSEPDEIYFPEEVTIAGIFSMGVYEFDSSVILIYLDQADDLFGYDWGSATTVHARVPDPFQMDRLTQDLRERLPGCRIVTWQEANQMLFGALRVEKNLMFFLLTFIVIVASFGIAGTLITVAVQKTREIGIMKAMGMGSGMIARIFVLQGAVIGVIGTAIGTGIGLLIIRYRNQVADILARIMGVEIFPKKLYDLSQIPALATSGDVIRIVVLAMVICVCASLVPALYASALSPARALQEET